MGSSSLASPAFVVGFSFFLLSHLVIHSSHATHPECGFGTIYCENGKNIINSKGGKPYEVKSFNETDNTIVIHDFQLSESLYKGDCSLFNFSISNFPSLSLEVKTPNLTMFKCKKSDDIPPEIPDLLDPGFGEYRHCEDNNVVLVYGKLKQPPAQSPPPPAPHDCSVFQFPVQPPSDGNWSANLFIPFVEMGFSLKWRYPSECHDCETKCGSYRNGALKNCAETNHGGKKKLVVILGIAAIATGIGIMMIVLCLISCLRCKKTKNDHVVEDFFKNYGSIAPKRYSYSDVKKMTGSFKDKLGKGGYGYVYKGKLIDRQKLMDRQLVAVKVLSEFKGNGEEFVNEVASISRTSHVNIVTLLGYCFEGRKRALIYEFMPNGSLEKFIYDKKSLETYPILGWDRLYKIAIGIARGLEYLHRGCNTRILHFDIKPHNILLDQDFCPKISDFGLAKLCPNKESIVSMLGARGTVGYIAPEVFSRSFGGVSHKSDVYSYGMMVLEMVGGRKNIDVGVDRTSEIYFPHWIYKRLKLDEGLGLHGLITEVEDEIARKMTLVGLWCIQTDPLNRPSITKVVEMLEGSLDSLQIPPKPYLSSPSRSPEGSPTTCEGSLITTVS